MYELRLAYITKQDVWVFVDPDGLQFQLAREKSLYFKSYEEALQAAMKHQFVPQGTNFPERFNFNRRKP